MPITPRVPAKLDERRGTGFPLNCAVLAGGGWEVQVSVLCAQEYARSLSNLPPCVRRTTTMRSIANSDAPRREGRHYVGMHLPTVLDDAEMATRAHALSGDASGWRRLAAVYVQQGAPVRRYDRAGRVYFRNFVQNLRPVVQK